MKYLLTISFVLFAFATGIVAQDKTAAEYKNEGNDALRDKDYATALENYEKAIENWEDGEPEDAMVYNAATCARRTEEFDKAIKYYEMAKERGFRDDIATYYIAYSLGKQGKAEEMKDFLKDAVEEYQNSKYVGHMEKLLVNYYLKKGSEPFNEASEILASAQNADPSQYDEITDNANEEFKKAKEWFEKALEIDPENEDAKSSLEEIEERLAGGSEIEE
ncbi:MAG: tetratricopeptide repeat protein [Marinilabiliaceae bacterium]